MARNRRNDFVAENTATESEIVKMPEQIAKKTEDAIEAKDIQENLPFEELKVEGPNKGSAKEEQKEDEENKEIEKEVIKPEKKLYHGQVIAVTKAGAFVRIPNNTALVQLKGVKVGDWVDF